MAASDVIVVIGGADVTPFARVGRVRIDDLLNDAPNAAALTLVAAPRFGPPETGPFAAHAFDNTAYATARNNAPTFAPPPILTGAPIQVYLGTIAAANQIFGGEILQREQYAELDTPAHVRYDLTCTDHTRRLNRRKVMKAYGAASASAIVLSLIAEFAPGITTANVQAGLATVTGGITFTFEDVSRSLSRIAEKIGAYWFVDYAADLHFFTGTEAGPAPAPIVVGADFADLKISADLSQVRTRILVEGDGGTATATLAAGESLIPISQTLPFSASGGLVRIGDVRGSYTGIAAGGAKTNTVGVGTPGTGGTPPPAAPGAPTVAAADGFTAGGLSGGPYYYAATFELADGSRSDIGAFSAGVVIGPAAAPGVTNAALLFTPEKGPIAVGVTSLYATSFLAANGRETNITTGGTGVTGRAVSAHSEAPFPGLIFGTSAIAPGFYSYRVTNLTPAGESLPGPEVGVNILAGGFNLVHIQMPRVPFDNRITGRRIYRSSVSTTPGGALPWRHVADVAGTPVSGTETFFDDFNADATLAPRNYPQVSSATDVGESATVTVPVSLDPRVVRRRLYRKDGPGEYRLIAEIPNNTATTFADVMVGPGGNLAPTSNGITTGAVNVSAIPIGPAGTVRRRVFRTVSGGVEFRELTNLANNTTTTYLDTQADSNLGGSPLPAQGTVGTGGTGPPPAPIGAGSLQVESLAGFTGAGWAVVESVLIRYASQSTAGGNFLTGIPASGPGAITAAIPAGTVITASPMLLGVAPAVAVTLGDAIQLLAQVDDLPAQAALAAVEGGDGIVEHYIQDRRLSFAGAHARGSAELALFKTVETTVTYTTRDVNTRSGATVSINLPAPTNLVGAFRIQRVTIDQVTQYGHTFPRRSVSASTTRLSFEDVLNRILLEQT